MTDRIIRVFIERQPDLYEELTTAMLTHGLYEGCYVQEYTEYTEDGQAKARFAMREAEESQP